MICGWVCVCVRERLCICLCVCAGRWSVTGWCCGSWDLPQLDRKFGHQLHIWRLLVYTVTVLVYIHCTVQCIPVQCYHLTADQNMLKVKDIQLWERTDLATSCKSNKKELVYQICRIQSRTDWLSLTFLWSGSLLFSHWFVWPGSKCQPLPAWCWFCLCMCSLNEGFTKYAECVVVVRLEGGEELRQYIASTGWCTLQETVSCGHLPSLFHVFSLSHWTLCVCQWISQCSAVIFF